MRGKDYVWTIKHPFLVLLEALILMSLLCILSKVLEKHNNAK